METYKLSYTCSDGTHKAVVRAKDIRTLRRDLVDGSVKGVPFVPVVEIRKNDNRLVGTLAFNHNLRRWTYISNTGVRYNVDDDGSMTIQKE